LLGSSSRAGQRATGCCHRGSSRASRVAAPAGPAEWLLDDIVPRGNLLPFPREEYKDSKTALPHCSARCTPAPPTLHAWVSLPPPLPSSQASRADDHWHPGRIRERAARSESADPTPIRVAIRVRRVDPSPPGRSEFAGSIRVSRVDPSRPARAAWV
jgi:hypothetical protein